MTHINNYIAHQGSTYNDNSVTINAQQNNTQFNTENQILPGDNSECAGQATGNNVFLNPQKGTKANLFRVILALQKTGFFVDKSGRQATQKDVFDAFGAMLGEDFSKFQKNLSQASQHNNDSDVSTKVFDDLKAAFEAYEGK